VAAAVAGAPFVRGAYTAGKLGVAVLGARRQFDVLQKLAELTIDFVTSQGDKLMLMGAAEAEARSGHDVIGQPGW